MRYGPRVDPVVLHIVFEGIRAVGDRRDLGPHPGLGIVHEVRDRLAEERHAVLLDDPGHALGAELAGADHGAVVAVVVTRRADVREQQLPHLVHVLALLLDLDRGDAQALVEDLRRLAGEAARHHAADLGHMADRHRIAHEPAVHEDGREEGVLRRVQAAPVGVVVHDDIALVHGLVRHLADAGLDEERHAADLRRAVVGDRDHVAVGVGDGAAEVERFVEDRRIGRLHHGDPHLPADGEHRRFDDVHRDDVHDFLRGFPRVGPTHCSGRQRRRPRTGVAPSRTGRCAAYTSPSPTGHAGPRFGHRCRRRP